MGLLSKLRKKATKFLSSGAGKIALGAAGGIGGTLAVQALAGGGGGNAGVTSQVIDVGGQQVAIPVSPPQPAGRFVPDVPPVRFDAAYYKSTYPDIADAINRRELRSAYLHYVLTGRYEGRKPRADAVGGAPVFPDPAEFLGKKAPVEFDEQFYVTQYPDIANAIARGELKSGYEHYIVHGRTEMRLPRAGAWPGQAALPPSGTGAIIAPVKAAAASTPAIAKPAGQNNMFAIAAVAGAVILAVLLLRR